MVRLHALTGLRESSVKYFLAQQDLPEDSTASVGVSLACGGKRCVSKDAKLVRKEGHTRCSSVLGDAFAFDLPTSTLKRDHGGGRCLTLSVKLRPGGQELGKVIVDLHGLKLMGWHKGEFVDYAVGTSTAKIGVSVYMRPVSRMRPWSNEEMDRLIPPKFRRPAEERAREQEEESVEEETISEEKVTPPTSQVGSPKPAPIFTPKPPDEKANISRCRSAPAKLQLPRKSALLSQQSFSQWIKSRNTGERNAAEGSKRETSGRVAWIQLPPGSGDGLSSPEEELSEEEPSYETPKVPLFLQEDVMIYAEPKQQEREKSDLPISPEKQEGIEATVSQPSVTYSTIKKIVDRIWRGVEEGEGPSSDQEEGEIHWSSDVLRDDLAQKARERAATREKLALLVSETAQQVEEQLGLHLDNERTKTREVLGQS